MHDNDVPGGDRATASAPGTRPSVVVPDTDQLLVGEFARLARVAFLICRDQSRADDAAAEAIARVWQRSLAGGIEDVRPYLYRTLVNLVTKGRRQFRSEQRAFGRHARFSTRSEIGEAVADRTDVGRALRTLSPEQRAVIVLRYFEGLSEDEIATALGISPGTVKSRASRGLSTLRVALRGDNGD